jgi:hypothetical protein
MPILVDVSRQRACYGEKPVTVWCLQLQIRAYNQTAVEALATVLKSHDQCSTHGVMCRLICVCELRCAPIQVICISRLCDRGLIEVGVNVTASRKKKSFRNVRVSMHSGPVRPGSSYNVYQFELDDRICVSIIIQPKFCLAEIIDFATQVWAIARVSAISPKFTSFFICFIRVRPHFYR